MVRQITQIGITVLLLLAACYTSTVNAHGKVEMEDDSCMRRIGDNMIHLSVYQPQVDVTGHYCTDIKQAGSALMVIDLVDPALREMPIGIKVIKGSHTEDGEVLTTIRPATYPDGVINMQEVLEQGKHILLVTADGMPPLNYQYHLRVEMINYEEVFRASIGPVVAILVTTLLGYKIVRSRRFKSWMAARRGEEISEPETNNTPANTARGSNHAAKRAAPNRKPADVQTAAATAKQDAPEGEEIDRSVANTEEANNSNKTNK